MASYLGGINLLCRDVYSSQENAEMRGDTGKCLIVPINFKSTPEEQFPWGVCVTGMSIWVGETHSKKRCIFSLNALLFLGFLSMLWPNSAQHKMG